MACYSGNKWSEEEEGDEEPSLQEADGNSDSEDSSREAEEELECALYSQIHYETNDTELSLNGSLYHSDVSLVEKNVETPKEKQTKPVSPTKSKKSKSKYVSVTYEIDTHAEKNSVKRKGDPVQYVIDTKGRTKSMHVPSDSEDSVVVLEPPQLQSPSPLTISDDSDHWTFSDSKHDSDSDDDSLVMELGMTNAPKRKNMDLQFNFKKPAGYDDLQAILNSLGDGDWSVNEYDRLGIRPPSNTPKPRYYIGKVGVKCHNCNERGHLSKDCMQPKKKSKCKLCGSDFHYGQCADMACYSCLRLGHTQHRCMDMKYPCHSRCFRCHRFGHVKEDCSDWWRQFHLTTKPDEEIVKGRGKKNPKRYCCYCTRQGHTVEECKDINRDSAVNRLPVFSPHVTKYDTLQQYTAQVQKLLGNLSLDATPKDKGRKNERDGSNGRRKGNVTRDRSQESKRKSNGNHVNGFEFMDLHVEKAKGKKRKSKISTQFVSTESSVDTPKRKKGVRKRSSKVGKHSLQLDEAT